MEMGKKVIITDELAGKLTAKWIKIKTAEREHRYVPDIDLSPYYVYRKDESQNSVVPYKKEDFLKVLIIDTKYYGNSMQKQYDKVTIHSGNMYQIFTYVKNQDVKNNGSVSGMLLYAKTEEIITPDCSFVIGGNKISVKTLDLNKEFKLIAAQLDKIAEDHFGKKRIEDSII